LCRDYRDLGWRACNPKDFLLRLIITGEQDDTEDRGCTDDQRTQNEHHSRGHGGLLSARDTHGRLHFKRKVLSRLIEVAIGINARESKAVESQSIQSH
jgi:hypothetical protein